MARFCGSEWPVRFDMGAIRALGRQIAPEDGTLGWVSGLILRLSSARASDDVEAWVYTLWAGIGADASGFTPVELLAVLDDAEPAEREAIPGVVLGALVSALPEPGGEQGDSGQPWSWPVAEAVWSTEWNQPADKFSSITLRDFHALSNGRAIMYASATEGAPSGNTQKVNTVGGWFELLQMRG